MRGMKSEDLLAIVDFLYRGEANVFQEKLDSFLVIAEELQLKGLMGKMEENFKYFEYKEKSLLQTFSIDINTSAKVPKPSLKIPVNKIHNPGDLEELDKQVKSMMEKSQNKLADGSRFKDRCKICGKEGFAKSIKDHIEANHIEGIIIPCNLCDKTFKSRHRLTLHKRQHQS